MIGSVRPANGQAHWNAAGAGQKDTARLRAESQATENQILLMKSGSDAPVEDIVDKLEQKQGAIEKALGPAKNAPAAGGASALERLKGQRDVYEPQEAPPSAGVYDVEAREEGGYGVRYKPYSGSEGEDETSESTTANTDKVDRELRALKKERDALKQQLAQAVEGPAAEKIGQRLEALENELRQKDNDSYRRQHAVFSE